MNNNDKINQLRLEIEEKTKLLNKLETESFDPLGQWEVTTEDDVEGNYYGSIKLEWEE